MRDWMDKSRLPSEHTKVRRVRLSEIPLPAYAQVKYDGELTYLWKDEEVGCVTANKWGRFRTDYPITDVAKDLFDEGVYVGELYVEGGDLYDFLRSRKWFDRLRLTVFDVDLDKPYYLRYKELEKHFPKQGAVHLVEGIVAKDVIELRKFFDDTVRRGFEGIVARPINQRYDESPYKLKKLQTADVVVLGVSKESKLFKLDEEKRMVGSLLIGCRYEDRFVSVGRVGSGFNLRQRRALYNALMCFAEREDDAYIYVKPALVLEISYQETVKSKQYDVGFTLRHPVFRKIKFDAEANDCLLEEEFQNAI